jgi:endonuclease YncB( thermonuclease family)
MIRSLLVIILIFSVFPVWAQSLEEPDINTLAIDFSDAKHTKSGRIDKIIDSLTIGLKDGTIVRLASTHNPDFHNIENAPYAEAALVFLKEKLPERTEVMLYQTRDRNKGRINRMEHQLAHVVTKEDKLWIQGALLEQGLAYVYTAPNNRLLLDEMYKAEEKARAERKGIWADDSLYKVITPEETDSKIGDFAVIEGTVKKVATVRNNTYLNFGQNWKTDFTIQIPPATRKAFARNGFNVLNFSGQKIRVRGYLREYNGPLIELKDTAHFEVVNTSPIKTEKDSQ